MIVYKKDSKGKIRFLEVYSEGNVVVQKSGLLDGKVVERRYKAKSKNIGKSNQTNPEQQAVLEAKAKIDNKMSEGYWETIEEAKNEVVLLPMLAHSYEKHVKKIEWPCYAQPKLDGMRAFYDPNNNTWISRKGKPITTLNHLSGLLLEDVPKNIILDGELYGHGMSFQECMSAIKKIGPTTSSISFHIYDVVMQNEPYDERLQYLKKLKFDKSKVKLVHTKLINDNNELKEYHKENIKLGFEGTMIRWGDFGYEINKRSQGLLKYKDFQDIAAKIIDVLPSDKDPKQGVVRCEMWKSGDNSGQGTKVEFNCGMKFSHEERKEILKNKHNYIGKTAEIRFFEYTDDGLPRFPVCVGFRLDK